MYGESASMRYGSEAKARPWRDALSKSNSVAFVAKADAIYNRGRRDEVPEGPTKLNMDKACLC